MSYSELSIEERATIQIGHAQGFSLGRIACLITRFPSIISAELRRNRDACGGYSARVAQQQMQARRQVYRPIRKLLPGSERFELVAHMLRERLSPEQDTTLALKPIGRFKNSPRNFPMPLYRLHNGSATYREGTHNDCFITGTL